MRIHNIKKIKESKWKLKDIDFYSKPLYKICTNVIEMARKWRPYRKPCSSLAMRYKQNSWNMGSVSIIGNHASPVIIRL